MESVANAQRAKTVECAKGVEKVEVVEGAQSPVENAQSVENVKGVESIECAESVGIVEDARRGCFPVVMDRETVKGEDRGRAIEGTGKREGEG